MTGFVAFGLGEHGIQQDSAAGRQEFERHMEVRRLEEVNKRRPCSINWRMATANPNRPVPPNHAHNSSSNLRFGPFSPEEA